VEREARSNPAGNSDCGVVAQAGGITGRVNLITDAILIPIGLWLARRGVKWLFTVEKHL
jgi:hypothetical protein